MASAKKHLILSHPSAPSKDGKVLKVVKYKDELRISCAFTSDYQMVFIRSDRQKTVEYRDSLRTGKYEWIDVTGPVYEFSHIEQPSTTRGSDLSVYRYNPPRNGV